MKATNKVVLVSGALMLASAPAWAQNTAASAAASEMKGFAAPTLQAPVAFGASWGGVGVGVGGQTLGNTEDGAAAVVFGLGDADKYAGLEVAAVSGSLFGSHGSKDSFGESGSIGLKLHTNVPGYASFAIGVDGTGRWGSKAYKDASTASVYAVATKMVPVGEFATVLNIGIGDGIYNGPNDSGANIFGSAAFYFTQQISVLAEYTGRFTNAAVSVAPFRSFPLTVTLGATNLGERFGGDVEFAGAIGYGFNFN